LPHFYLEILSFLADSLLKGFFIIVFSASLLSSRPIMLAIELTRRGFCKLAGFFCLCGPLFIPHHALSSVKKRPLHKKGGWRMHLPVPILDGDVSLERAIHKRRTIRSFDDKVLTLNQLSQLLWAAQGITEPGGFKRSAPSAGALYPIDIYAVVGSNSIAGLEPGVYHYEPSNHSISLFRKDDMRKDVANASLSQMWMAHTPLNLIITAEYSRIMGKYGHRGIRYAMIEAGHIGQNIFLQAQAMGLAAGIVGAFEDEKVIKVMGIKETHEPLLVMPVGYEGT
jgi:SagB-type dehydrogenase family enzyme